MKFKEYKEPSLVMESRGNPSLPEVENYLHDAYGTVTMTIVHGVKETLFGSDLPHNERVRISIQRASLRRDLSHDWIHGECLPMVEFEMSHAQFASFITSKGNGGGTPVTLVYAPPVGDKPARMPGIKQAETKHELFRREIRKSAQERVEAMLLNVEKLEAMIESGKMPKKELRDLCRNLKSNVENTPSSLEFVVQSAEEALEKATHDAKIEVEAYIANRITRAGIKALTSQETSGSIVVYDVIEQDPCPGCAPGVVCRTPKCGRLKARVE